LYVEHSTLFDEIFSGYQPRQLSVLNRPTISVLGTLVQYRHLTQLDGPRRFHRI